MEDLKEEQAIRAKKQNVSKFKSGKRFEMVSPALRSWYINDKDVNLDEMKVIGKGSFGRVYECNYNNLVVAAKTCTGGAKYIKQFAQEYVRNRGSAIVLSMETWHSPPSPSPHPPFPISLSVHISPCSPSSTFPNKYFRSNYTFNIYS